MVEFASIMAMRYCFDYHAVLFKQKAGYIDVSMELCLSNRSNTGLALNSLLYHSNYICFILKKLSFA